jgi:hypothetical protein
MGTSTTLRSSPTLINLPLLDLICYSFFMIINAEVTVLGRVVRVEKTQAKRSKHPIKIHVTENGTQRCVGTSASLKENWT